MVRNPMAHDLPSHLRPNEGPKSNTRPSIEKAIAASGLDIKAMLELSKTHPEILVSIRDQLTELLENGATQGEITEFFRKQSEVSATIASVTDTSPNWQRDLAALRDKLPKAN